MLINFKLDLLAPILKLRKLQLTLLEMLSDVLQKPIEKKYGNNPPYLAYKKKTKKQLSNCISYHFWVLHIGSGWWCETWILRHI